MMRVSTTTILAILYSAIAAPVAGNGIVSLPLSVKSRDVHNSKRSADTPEANFTTTESRYLIPVTIGGQTVEVVLDTGSSYLWVKNKETYSKGYNSSESSTFVLLNQPFNNTYTGGTINGTWAKDTVTIGDSSVTGYDFAIVDHYGHFDSGGTFGIGASYRREIIDADSYELRLYREHVTKSDLFSFYGGADSANGHGSVIFGGIDEAKFEGPLKYVQFNSQFAYDINFKVDGTELTGSPDTGAPYNYLPQDVADRLAARYNATWNAGAGLYLRDTPLTSDYEPLEFEFGTNTTASIAAEHLTEPFGSKYALTFVRTTGPSLLGLPFLREQYNVFENINNGLGENGYYAFAPYKNSTESKLVATVDYDSGAVPA